MSLQPTSRRRALLAAAIAFVAACAIFSLVFALGPREYSRTTHIARAASIVVLTGVAWALISRWWRGTVPTPTRADLARFGIGWLLYVVPWALVAVPLLASGTISFRLNGSVVQLLLSLVALQILVLAYEALPEELMVRDLMQRSFSVAVGRWLAVLLQAVAFVAWAFVNGAGRTPERMLFFFVFSVTQGLILMWSGSVATTIGFHAGFQVIGQLLTGTSWPILDVDDPQRWFDLAIAAPAVLAPIAAWTIWRRRRSSAEALEATPVE